MSFHSDKKNEHESAACRALKSRDYADAFFHTIKAAEYGYNLAEQSEGAMKEAYVKDANELLDLAEQIKAKAKTNGQSVSKEKEKEDITEGSDEEKRGEKSPWELAERPDVKLDDVVGLDEVKKVIREDVLNAMAYSDAYQMCKIPPGGGALMYGPPGCGKTYIAKAIAGELDAAFFSASGAQIKNKYVGETERNMRRLFEDAAKHERAVIFLDEIHSILGQRGNEKVNAVDEFLVLADGIQKRKNNLLILGATNYPWRLADPVFRRLGKIIYVGLPDAPARTKIFELQFEETPHEDDFSFGLFGEKSENFSGADIAQICSSAKKKAIQRMIDTKAEKPLITADDVLTVMTTTRPTVSNELLERYRQWSEFRSSETDSSSDNDE